MMKKLAISVQTGDWFDELFGGEPGADAGFAFIKNCGFDTLDLNMDHALNPGLIEKGVSTEFSDRSLEQMLEYYRPVKEAAEKHGITIAMAHAIFPLHSIKCPEFDEYLVELLIKQFAVCGYLGIPNLVVHPITLADRKLEWEMNMKLYPALIPYAKKYGVTICLENMFAWIGSHGVRRACADADEACRYIDTLNNMAGEDLFGFCYDVGHANLLGCNIYEDLKTLGKRVTVLHIHENDGWMDRHCIPYTYKAAGNKMNTDWEGFLNGLKEIGYEGPLNFETFASLKEVPTELVPEMLKLINSIGKYFRSRLC